MTQQQLAMVVYGSPARDGKRYIHNVVLYPWTDAGQWQMKQDRHRLEAAGYATEQNWLCCNHTHVEAWLKDDEEFKELTDNTEQADPRETERY